MAWCRRAGMTTPPGAIRESPLQEILAVVAGIRPSLIESPGHASGPIAPMPVAAGPSEGMRSGSCGLVQRILGRWIPASRRTPTPFGGQAPALHFLIPPSANRSTMPARFARGGHGIEVDWRAHFRTIDEFGGGNHSFSYQSLMPAGAGTTRYARWGCWLVEGVEGHWCLELVLDVVSPSPQPSPIEGEEAIWILLLPVQFGAIGHLAKLRLPWIVARGPGCGQAPALHFLLPLSAVNSRVRQALGFWEASYPGSESGTCFRTDAEDDTFSIDCDGGQERLGEASGFAFARKPCSIHSVSTR